MHTTSIHGDKNDYRYHGIAWVSLVCSCKLINKGGKMPTKDEIDDMIASYTTDESELIAELLDMEDDEHVDGNS